MTWLGYLNFCVVQWCFVRIARVVDEHTGETTSYKVIGPVVPLTGWWSDYVWLTGPER